MGTMITLDQYKRGLFIIISQNWGSITERTAASVELIGLNNGQHCDIIGVI